MLSLACRIMILCQGNVPDIASRPDCVRPAFKFILESKIARLVLESEGTFDSSQMDEDFNHMT